MNPALWFPHFSAEMATLLISMFPITELRASIPIGIGVFGLPVWKVWVLAVVGDFIPAVFLLFFLPKFHDWILEKRFPGRIFERHLEQAQHAFSGKYSKHGAIALIVFIGIPLPLTGSWTGSLAAFIFNIPFRRSWWMVLAGVCMAATIVTAITLFADGALRWIKIPLMLFNRQ